MKKWRRRENASLTRIGGAWIAKLPDNGMAQCNQRATDFSISCGGHTDVCRHQESARHAKLAKSKGLYEGCQDGPVAYVVHGQNEVDSVTRAETMFAFYTSANFLSRVFALISLTFAPALAKC